MSSLRSLPHLLKAALLCTALINAVFKGFQPRVSVMHIRRRPHRPGNSSRLTHTIHTFRCILKLWIYFTHVAEVTVTQVTQGTGNTELLLLWFLCILYSLWRLHSLIPVISDPVTWSPQPPAHLLLVPSSAALEAAPWRAVVPVSVGLCGCWWGFFSCLSLVFLNWFAPAVFLPVALNFAQLHFFSTLPALFLSVAFEFKQLLPEPQSLHSTLLPFIQKLYVLPHSWTASCYFRMRRSEEKRPELRCWSTSIVIITVMKTHRRAHTQSRSCKEPGTAPRSVWASHLKQQC